ncbi:MAG: glycosyltransferase [Thioalkalivibrionaceae bacterium]
MRVSEIMLGKGFGGAERTFVDLVVSLVEAGHQVQAILEPRGAAYRKLHDYAASLAVSQGGARLDPSGVDQVDAREADDCARGMMTLTPVRVRGAWDVWAAAMIRRSLARFGPEIVHGHLARGSHLGGRAARALRIPMVSKLHNDVKLHYYRHVDHFQVTTAHQRQYLLDHGVEGHRVTQIPNFSRTPPRVDDHLGMWGSAAVEHGGEPRPLTMVGLGRLVHKKGFDVVLEALARLRVRNPRLTFELAGDGPERASLEERCALLGLRDAVVFHGWVDDVAEFLDRGDLFVLPSRDEPFGIVVIEAMARALPIIATRTDGPLEILDCSCAWLCDFDNVTDLERALAAALESSDERVARAKTACERYRLRYHVDVVVPRLVDWYGEVIAASRAR